MSPSIRERTQPDIVVEPRVGSAVDDIDQLPQDGELELQLQAVYGALERDLNGIVAGVLEAEEDKVHDDDEDVDPQKLMHELAVPRLRPEAQELDRLGDVEP